MPFFGSRLSTTLPEIENARSTSDRDAVDLLADAELDHASGLADA